MSLISTTGLAGPRKGDGESAVSFERFSLHQPKTDGGWTVTYNSQQPRSRLDAGSAMERTQERFLLPFHTHAQHLHTAEQASC